MNNSYSLYNTECKTMFQLVQHHLRLKYNTQQGETLMRNAYKQHSRVYIGYLRDFTEHCTVSLQ